MNVILILILASLAIALVFLGGFVWAVRSGQFDDTLTPSLRVLMDDPVRKHSPTSLAELDAAAENRQSVSVECASGAPSSSKALQTIEP